MMNLPNLHRIGEQALRAALRFPASILTAFVGFFLCVSLLHRNYSADNEDKQIVLLLLSNAAMVFSLAVAVWAERSKLKKLSVPIQFAAIVFIYSLYFTISFPLVDADVYQIGIYVLAAHFFIAFAAFLKQGTITGFWQFNRCLFQRIIQSVLFSGTFFIGISVAILAFNELFNANFSDKVFGDLFSFSLCIFNTWYFLAGIPSDWEAIDKDSEYPNLLKQFTQFVLLPLVVVYLGILYLYIGKIAIEFSLPSGWVGWLVLCFSIAGILALLLVWPIQEQAENKWVLTFSKYFYWALFPLIGLLFLASYERILQYGLTPNRYYLVELALWLVCMALYFTFSREKNIKRVPQSLFVAALISLAGPVGAVNWSVRSQINRFQEILTRNNALKNGKFIAEPSRIWKNNDAEQLRSIVTFLRRTNSFDKVQPFLAVSLDSVRKSTRYKNGMYAVETQLETLLGIGYESLQEKEERFYCNFSEKNPKWLAIAGYDYYLTSGFGRYYQDSWVIPGFGTFTPNHERAIIKFVSEKGETELIDFKPVVQLCKTLKQRHSDTYLLPADSTRLSFDFPSLSVIIQTSSVETITRQDSIIIENWHGDILLKKH